ncbi:MAG: dienelactone hydrolase [Bacteroidia bacterium]
MDFMKHFLIIFLATISTPGFAQFQIGSRTITVNDPSRSRDIGCEVYYPATSSGNNAPVENGQFPVIVVGHGFSMGVGAYENWWTEFVPEGYIFILPTTEVGPFPFPSHPDFGLDIAFVALEARGWNTDQSSDFFGKVAERTGLMGHSMGGGCSFLAAENNPIIDCILGLAPAETNTSAIDAAANVTAPTLVFWGTEDEVTPEAGNALAIYNNSSANCKNYVRIDQGSHCLFAESNFFCDLGETNTGTLTREEQHQVSFSLARPFFEYFLKNDCAAYDELQDEIATNPDLGTNILDCANDAPVISDNNGTMESDLHPNYQWYLNGDEIPNANQQTHTYTQSGTYQVGTTILGNCPTLSNEIIVQITGIIQREINLSTWGNEIQIGSRDQLNDVRLEWFDISGKLIASESISSVSANQLVTIEKPNFVGVKLLRLSSNQATKTWKLF